VEEKQVKGVKFSCAEFSKHEAMKILGEVELQLHLLYLGTKWTGVVTFTPRLLQGRGKSPCYLLDRKQGGPHCRSGRCGEEIYCFYQESNPDLPARSPSLYRLVCKDKFITLLRRLKKVYVSRVFLANPCVSMRK
jgi:hypothetical protein